MRLAYHYLNKLLVLIPEDEEKYDFELDVNFPKTGGYSSELLLGPEWMPIGEIVAINASEGSGVEKKDLRLVDEGSNSYRFQLVTDEECAYEVRDCQKNDGTSCTVRINVTAESGLPEQKSNVLEVLRARQIKAGVYQVDASSSDNDLALIQSSKLSSSGESYQPLVGILGGDKAWSSWRTPNDDGWRGAILGGSNLHQDIRPTNICPPDKLISAWKNLELYLWMLQKRLVLSKQFDFMIFQVKTHSPLYFQLIARVIWNG